LTEAYNIFGAKDREITRKVSAFRKLKLVTFCVIKLPTNRVNKR